MAGTEHGDGFDWVAYRRQTLELAETLIARGIGDAERVLLIAIRFVPAVGRLDPEAVLAAFRQAAIEARWSAADDRFAAGIDATLTTALAPETLADAVEAVVRVGVAAGCRPVGWRIS